MAHYVVNSLDDVRLAPYRELPRANLTARSGRFVVEGQWMVQRLAASDYAVDSVVVDERRLALIPAELPDSVPVFVLPGGMVETLIGFNFHRGILACGRRGRPLAVADVLCCETPRAVFVVCCDVQDPTNLGGILRNAAAFGAAGVLLSRQCADAFSRRVLRVSMGTAFRLRIARSDDLLADLRHAQSNGELELVAAVLDPHAERLETAPRAARLAVLIGNEGQGLADEWLAECHRRVTLPMDHGTDSLNAASASAVFLYHFTRIARGS
ncbi:MAG: TrmH family RNA methyltransferase [Pirellulaceae bacterium]